MVDIFYPPLARIGLTEPLVPVSGGTPGSGIPATSTTPESCLEVIDFVENRAPYCCLKFIYFEKVTKI